MRRSFFLALVFGFIFTVSAQAADFTSLKGPVRGYTNLSNTPEAPDIEFTDKEGNTVSLKDFRGKTVLLNLWATWCPPCIREMPALNELAKKFKDDDFLVIAIATGRQGREDPDSFLEKRKLTDIKNYHDKGQEFLKLMGINTLPVSFMIDKNGIMQGGVIGMTEWDDDDAVEAIAKVLK